MWRHAMERCANNNELYTTGSSHSQLRHSFFVQEFLPHTDARWASKPSLDAAAFFKYLIHDQTILFLGDSVMAGSTARSAIC